MTPPTGRSRRPHTSPAAAALVAAALVAAGAALAPAGPAASWTGGSATTASPWSGPLVIAAAVMALAGLAKVVRPAPAADALAGIGVPLPLAAVRVLGANELVVGTVAVVAVGYLSFAVVARAMGRAGAAGCGCFGRSGDATPGALHVTLNLLAAAAAGGAALTSAGGVQALVAHTPWAGIPAAVASAVGAALLVAAYVVIPEVQSSATAPTGPRTFSLVEDAPL